MEPKNIPKPLRGRALLPSGLLCKKMKKKTKKKKKPRAEAAGRSRRRNSQGECKSHTQIRFFHGSFSNRQCGPLACGMLCNGKSPLASLDSRHQSYESSLILDTALMNMFQDMLCKSSVLVQPRPHSLLAPPRCSSRH